MACEARKHHGKRASPIACGGVLLLGPPVGLRGIHI
jgi:hypothetical protein